MEQITGRRQVASVDYPYKLAKSGRDTAWITEQYVQKKREGTVGPEERPQK